MHFLHLGRFCRLRNYNTLYICGTDEYGTATETKVWHSLMPRLYVFSVCSFCAILEASSGLQMICYTLIENCV